MQKSNGSRGKGFTIRVTVGALLMTLAAAQERPLNFLVSQECTGQVVVQITAANRIAAKKGSRISAQPSSSSATRRSRLNC